MVWITAALVLFILQILTILLGEFRHPSKAVAWMFILFLIPVVGFVMYYFMAKEYTQRKKVLRKGHQYISDIQNLANKERASGLHMEESVLLGYQREPRLFALLNSIRSSLITLYNEAEVLTNAEKAYASMIRAMEEARHHIHFEFYTVRADHTGRRFQEVLMRKAKDGVRVRCIFDGVGSYQLQVRFIRELREAGCEVFIFLKPWIAFFDKRMNYRNHRKILIVDGRVGFLGGINIGDEYLGENPKLGFWRDTHMRFEGDAVFSLQHTFLTDWYFVSGRRINHEDFYPEHSFRTVCPIQIISSGPDDHRDGVLEMYFAAITTAKRRIFITTPYFIPDEALRMGLKSAALSGVDVRIIYPLKSDSILVGYAAHSFMEDLMQSGVRFYSYCRGFVHSKVLIVDDLFGSVGTANMDMRSFYSNFELTAVMFDPALIRRLELDFIEDLRSCRELEYEAFRSRPLGQKSREVIARLLAPLF